MHLQQSGLDRGGPAKSPEQRREAMNELLLDRRLRQILGDDRVLEGPIPLGILQRLDNGFGSESVPEGITPRPLFPVFGLRARALEGVVADVMGRSTRPPPPGRLGAPKLARRWDLDPLRRSPAASRLIPAKPVYDVVMLLTGNQRIDSHSSSSVL